MPEFDPYAISVILDLERLGELIGTVAQKMCELRDIDPPEYDGQEMRELAIAGWRHVVFMHDRSEFTRDVKKDLAEMEIAEPQANHRPEFG